MYNFINIYRKALQSDLQQYLSKAKLGTATFAEYKTITAENKEEQEQNRQIDNPCDYAKTKEEYLACCKKNPGVCEPREGTPISIDKPQIYYFHPDHLGTATFLTDINGNAYSFFLNLPFGETQAEQQSITDSFATPYKFTGKELDDETGLYYFGARYYDPKISIWLSVDPLSEKYPGRSPYEYCASNPINLVDPDGRSFYPPGGFPREDGVTHTDNDGSWIYNKTTDVWKGQNGSSDYSNYQQLNEIKIHTVDPNEGTYFDRDIKGSGEYGPYIPDAIGITVSASVNTGLFGNFGGSVGCAADVHHNVEGYVGGFMDIGPNGSVGIPKLSFSLALDFHDSYSGNNNSIPANSISGGVLGNIAGDAKTYNVGLGLKGGFSHSLDQNGNKAFQGVETKSIGLGFGLNAQSGRSKTYTFTDIFKKTKNLFSE